MDCLLSVGVVIGLKAEAFVRLAEPESTGDDIIDPLCRMRKTPKREQVQAGDAEFHLRRRDAANDLFGAVLRKPFCSGNGALRTVLQLYWAVSHASVFRTRALGPREKSPGGCRRLARETR
jgi:hypothetical protein